MSAFVVDREHIDVLLAAGLSRPSDRASWFHDGDWHELTYENADVVGRMLYEENVASVCARYDDDTADLYEDVLAYVFTDPGFVPSAVETLKAITCLDYQSCEHDGWLESEAKAFCNYLRDTMIHRLDGMGTAPWEWTAEDVAKRPKAHRIFGGRL